MAKNGLAKYNKKKQKKQQVKKVTSIDFKDIINEFDKLLGKRFVFFLGNGEWVTFTVETKHFCHMLGFDKISDATIISLLGSYGFKRSKFYDYVKDGYVNFNHLDLDSILEERHRRKLIANKFDFNVIRTFDQTEHKVVLYEVIEQRWSRFSEENILSIIHNEIVIDFDYKKHYSLVPADKIFYKYNPEKKKNVNLFISKENGEYFIRTFFMEKDLDEFKVTYEQNNDGTLKKSSKGKYIKEGSQKIEDILINIQLNKFNDAELKTMINWNNVRKKFEDKAVYRPVNRLKNDFDTINICSDEVVQGIAGVKSGILKHTESIERIKNYVIIRQQFDDYLANDSDESKYFFMEFGEHGLDIEDEETHTQFESINIDDLNEEIQRLTMKLESSNKKLKKYEKFLPLLIELEINEIRYVYANFFDVSKWEDSFIEENLNLLRCVDTKTVLSKIKEMAEEDIKWSYKLQT